MHKYEEITNINRRTVVAHADRILSEGWARRGYPSVDLNDRIPWRMMSQEDRSWNFYIHCWDMLDCLLASHSETGNQGYFRPAFRIALEWSDLYANPGSFGAETAKTDMAWYDMAVGLRAYRLAYVLDVAKEISFGSEEERASLWGALCMHCAYLADDGNIKFHNNHGFFQVAGQLAMGRRFRNGSALMEKAYRQGEKRFQEMLERQFSADGIHKEHSPDYHRMVYETLRGLIDSGLVVSEKSIAFSKKIEAALSWFVQPNGYIANLGDSDYRLMKRKPRDAERKWCTDQMRYAVTAGEIGTATDEKYIAFRQGGYFVLRAPPQDDDRFEASTYLAQQAGFHSRVHKHADDLSFIWHDRGSDILVDAGRFGYIGKTTPGSELAKQGFWYSDPYRIYCESTRAHNCLAFDDADYPRKGVKPYGSALGRVAESDSGNVIAVETEVRHFKGMRHVRVLFLCPGRWLIAYDWFKDQLDVKRDVSQWFHFAPSLKVDAGYHDYRVDIPDASEPLQIRPLLEGVSDSEIVVGETTPRIQGWWSPKEKEVLPGYALNYKLQQQSTGAVATIFCFADSLDTSVDESVVNVSGRAGAFVWYASGRKNKLMFDRPALGSMKVDFTSSRE